MTLPVLWQREVVNNFSRRDIRSTLAKLSLYFNTRPCSLRGRGFLSFMAEEKTGEVVAESCGCRIGMLIDVSFDII
jgi:hypothetical protein